MLASFTFLWFVLAYSAHLHCMNVSTVYLRIVVNPMAADVDDHNEVED